MTKLEEHIDMGEDPHSPMMGLQQHQQQQHHSLGAHGGPGGEYFDDYTYMEQQQQQQQQQTQLHLSSYPAPLVHTGSVLVSYFVIITLVFDFYVRAVVRYWGIIKKDFFLRGADLKPTSSPSI